VVGEEAPASEGGRYTFRAIIARVKSTSEFLWSIFPRVEPKGYPQFLPSERANTMRRLIALLILALAAALTLPGHISIPQSGTEKDLVQVEAHTPLSIAYAQVLRA
jgi:hypothetical protein